MSSSLTFSYTQAGYRDGIGEGKAATAQRGFDEGFGKIGVPIGRELGLLRGVAASLLAYLTSNASSTTTASISEYERNSITSETRNVIRALGRIRLSDLAPRDLEAEEHARAHGEEIELPQELKDKRDMESLEDSLGAMGGDAHARRGGGQEDLKAEVQACRITLKSLLERAGMQETAQVL